MKERFPSADMLGQLAIALGKMDWSPDDKLVVKIGGVANSGIHQTEGANPKWAKPFGTVPDPYRSIHYYTFPRKP